MDAFHNKCKEKRDMVDCWKTKAEMVYWIVRIFLMLLHTINHEMKERFVEDGSKWHQKGGCWNTFYGFKYRLIIGI